MNNRLCAVSNVFTSITRPTKAKLARGLSNFDNEINVHAYFLHERPFANVKISLNQEIIWCDKASLASASPVLREQLLHTADDGTLVVDDVELSAFLAMLEFVYPIFTPEINEGNISCLIELAHRFQFDTLRLACQRYVMKYLNTIRRVAEKCQHVGAEGDYFGNSEHEANGRHRPRNLIEFRDRICLDAFDTTSKLSRWLKTYHTHDSALPSQAILSTLRQLSVNYLEQAMAAAHISAELEARVYKARAQYLEQIRPANRST